MTYHDPTIRTTGASRRRRRRSRHRRRRPAPLSEKGSEAKEKASEVVGQAQSAVGEVASTAKDQARVLTEEAKYQAARAHDHHTPAAVGAGRAASATRLPRASERCRPDAGAQGRTSTGREDGRGVDRRDTGARPQLVRPARGRRRRRCAPRPVELARRRPLLFLGACMAAGVVVGRLVKDAASANGSSGKGAASLSRSNQLAPGGIDDVLPAPVTIEDPVAVGGEAMP